MEEPHSEAVPSGLLWELDHFDLDTCPYQPYVLISRTFHLGIPPYVGPRQQLSFRSGKLTHHNGSNV
ncbi:hypothetical protein Lalb_Chr16g0384741 [Lupinus albus]|uniref:Uncharacterized protein n=1 Tax=Lupinus albus TaxID=3870 RepID=A0A6A4NUE7_LUPAL|nr:hypothetical protein Lalb_Chr16g0384741 [Lupinus albus]